MPLTTIYAGGTRVIGDAGALEQTIHPTALTYLNRLKAAGYNVPVSEIDALNKLVWGMAANGILAQMQWFHPCMGNSQAHMALDLFGSTYDITFFGSWTFASTGMKTTTASTANYATFGYNPSIAGNTNDAHLGIYVRNNPATANVIVGSNNTSLQFFQISAVSTANNGNVIIGSLSNFSILTGITDSRGHWLASRTSSTILRGFFNGSLNVTNTATTPNLPNATVTYGARNNLGTREFPSNQEIAVAHGGRSLTIAQARTLYILIQQFNTALGRQV